MGVAGHHRIMGLLLFIRRNQETERRKQKGGRKGLKEKFTSDFRIIAEYFSAVREHREEELRYNRQAMRHVEEVLDFFRVFSRDRRFEECKPVILREAKKGAVNMCTVMDYAEKQGKIEGKIEGKREQALETAMEMIRAGEGPDKIRRYTKLSEEKIRELQKGIG